MNDDRAPFVSVIVPTYQREAVLCDTIRGLLRQDYPAYEVIVVDQTPTHADETRRFLWECRDEVRHIRLERPSLTRAINTGIAAARGDIVLLVDDDIVPYPSLISAHVSAYADVSIGAVAGQILSDDRSEVDTSLVGHIDRRMTILSHFNASRGQDVWHAPGANMSVRADVLKKIGGVEPRFGGNAFRWETDLSLRLLRCGYRIVFEPRASLIHVSAPTGGCRNRDRSIWWYYWYMHNGCLLGLRHRPLFSMWSIGFRPLTSVLLTPKGVGLIPLWLVALAHATLSWLRSADTPPNHARDITLPEGLDGRELTSECGAHPDSREAVFGDGPSGTYAGPTALNGRGRISQRGVSERVEATIAPGLKVALVAPEYVVRPTSGHSSRLRQIQEVLSRVGGEPIGIWDLSEDRAFRAGDLIHPAAKHAGRCTRPRPGASALGAVRSLVALSLFTWPRFNVRLLAPRRRARILSWLERERPGYVVLVHPWSTELIPDLLTRDVSVFVDCQNVESEIARDLAKMTGSLRSRLDADVRARAIRRVEQWLFPMATEVWMPSDADIARQREICEGRGRFRLVPNALDMRGFPGLSEAGGHDILFPAYFGYPPNVDAATTLTRTILPMVRQRVPMARVVLAGRDPTGAAAALAGSQGVIATGEVPDMRPYFESAAVVAVPLRYGSGTRFKILEALAWGRPVVTTPLGCEGIDVRDGEHLLIRDSADFPDAICGLLADPTRGRCLALAGREVVEQRYSWTTVEAALRQALGSQPAGVGEPLGLGAGR